MFTNKKREGVNTSVCAVSLYVAETPKTSTKDHEPPLSIMPFGIVAYGFVGQSFLETAVKEINLEHENEDIQMFPNEER